VNLLHASSIICVLVHSGFTHVTLMRNVINTG
jgi:hypothetical protein